MIENLKFYRNSRRMTQKELSEKTGISVRRISSYECEPVEPDIGTLQILADFFSITIDELIGRKMPTVFDNDKASEIDLSNIGPRLRQCRIEKKMLIKDVATKAGISEAYLSVIETGGKTPSLETFVEIIRTLGASSDAILMDCLPTSFPIKANYVERKISCLPHELQLMVLTNVDSYVEMLLKDKR